MKREEARNCRQNIGIPAPLSVPAQPTAPAIPPERPDRQKPTGTMDSTCRFCRRPAWLLRSWRHGALSIAPSPATSPVHAANRLHGLGGGAGAFAGWAYGGLSSAAGDGFLTSDEIYIKMLPNGEARRVTDDAPAEIRAGILTGWGGDCVHGIGDSPCFPLTQVSALGGEPHLLMKNAAGLVHGWTREQLLFFRCFDRGKAIHLGVVRATADALGRA